MVNRHPNTITTGKLQELRGSITGLCNMHAVEACNTSQNLQMAWLMRLSIRRSMKVSSTLWCNDKHQTAIDLPQRAVVCATSLDSVLGNNGRRPSIGACSLSPGALFTKRTSVENTFSCVRRTLRKLSMI